MRRNFIKGSIDMVENKSRIKWRRALTLVLCAVLMLSVSIGALALNSSAATPKNNYKGLRVIPGGIPFGLKFSTDGVVVIGFCDIDEVQKSKNPAYLAGLRAKDIITMVDGKRISDADELTKTVESSGGKAISLTYVRSGQEKTVTLTPVFSKSENKYKTGIWVRDSGAGIGTVTYIIPSSGVFGGLGHGICDGETGELIPMSRGIVMDVNISAIKKGIAGVPGEIKGYFGTSNTGKLTANTECGVYGVFNELPQGLDKAIEIGMRDEVKCGEAKIICTLANGDRREYKIEISSINRDSMGSKCFVVNVKDPALIEKTGGIVQGMSGSPIIQNGKLIGAVTHVMINDPTTGYGIFIENMLNAAQMPMAKAS